ncbi:MAG TPA: hypothetical protein VMU54_10215 [Planctomycetota bacterium]|nr:hypothetical protein [Planctomycetota bacterium]
MNLIAIAFLLIQEAPPLSKVDLGPTPLALLSGRLALRMPEGTIEEPRGHSLMGAPEPNTRETRLVWTSGDRKCVVMAYELFRSAGKDFEAEVRKQIGSWGLEGEVSTRPERPGFRVCDVVPKIVDPSTEAVFVLGLFSAREDGTVQYVVFYFNPKAAEDAAGCRELARKAAGTLEAGARVLARESGTRVLEELADGKQCVLDVPEGFTVTVKKGPDFQVASVLKIVPLGETGPSLNAYFGGHPRFQYEREDARPAITKSDGKLLGQATEWHRWTQEADSKSHFKEAMAPLPGSRQEVIHAFLIAPDAAGLQEVENLATKLRISDKK